MLEKRESQERLNIQSHFINCACTHGFSTGGRSGSKERIQTIDRNQTPVPPSPTIKRTSPVFRGESITTTHARSQESLKIGWNDNNWVIFQSVPYASMVFTSVLDVCRWNPGPEKATPCSFIKRQLPILPSVWRDRRFISSTSTTFSSSTVVPARFGSLRQTTRGWQVLWSWDARGKIPNGSKWVMQI